MQSNADASILSGNGLLNPTTIGQSILGFNGRHLLQDPTVKVDFYKHPEVAMLMHSCEYQCSDSPLLCPAADPQYLAACLCLNLNVS